MSLKLALLLSLLAASAGIGFGYLLRLIISLGKKGSVELDVLEMEIAAKEEAQKVVLEAEKRAEEIISNALSDSREKEVRIKNLEDRLVKKEEYLDKRQKDLDVEGQTLKNKLNEIEIIKQNAENLSRERIEMLASTAGISPTEARNELIKTIEKENEADLFIKTQKLENEGVEKLEIRAREIISTAIQRLATSIPEEMMATTLNLPSDDMKGKIIGKEGRNIKAFEKATGVELVIDDTPNSILLSSFDPVRRAIAQFALENLIKDGRIQPAKIEEHVEKAKDEIGKIIREKGEEACRDAQVYNLDPRIINLLGRLHFRSSYSQNVLSHSVEMSHIAGMIAEEIGANVSVSRAGALLHDIGKALDHEVSGTHVEIGRRILQKFGVSEEIIKAMQAHHGEYPYETTESIIVQTADAISGSRPGARRDNLLHYLKRLEDLESIATSFDGVEKAYALQAGREIRVFVTPEKISDLGARKIARDIANQIERDLKYPGEIRVSVIRENRIIEYAR